jgi:hypothetical protein
VTALEQGSLFDLRDAMTPLGFDPDAFARIESVDEIVEIAASFGALNSTVRWNVGDFLNFVDRSRFAEAYEQILSSLGLARRTIDNWRSVCAGVALSRRRETLSWSHHEAVASLPPRAQRSFLDKAERHGWTVDEIRDAVRDAYGQESLDGETGDARESLSDVARRVWSHSQRDGDMYRTPVEDMLALARAIGAA